MSEAHDLKVEQEIKEKGLDAPRVTKEEMDGLVDSLKYWVGQVEGTTTIVATAVLPMGDDNFTLATEYSACASPENFDYELGKEIACQKAEDAARNMLWLLEGYALKKELAK